MLLVQLGVNAAAGPRLLSVRSVLVCISLQIGVCAYLVVSSRMPLLWISLIVGGARCDFSTGAFVDAATSRCVSYVLFAVLCVYHVLARLLWSLSLCANPLVCCGYRQCC